MMSEFSGYEKMPTSLKKLGLSGSDFSAIDKLKWIVTEKIHGANFSFIYENGQLKFAKRKAYLTWTDDFFGFQLVVSKIEDNILQLFEQLSNTIAGTKYMVYGELFGGEYPHPDVAPVKEVQAIQTGVHCTPSIEFCAFDIAIETSDAASKYYLDYESSIRYFQQFNIFHVKSLFIGKLGDALSFNTKIDSSVPKAFRLPEITGNVIEGVVIKPFNQTGESGLAARPIIKLKNPEFDEEDKFHEAEKWSFIPQVSSKTEDLPFIVDELRNYITHNRLQSAVSKIGKLDRSNTLQLAEIRAEFLADTIADFNENNNLLLNELSPDEKEWIMKRVAYEIDRVMATNSGI